MKQLFLFFFLCQSYLQACTLCATDIPQVLVDTQITYDKNETHFEVHWEFHKEFVNSLTQYDLNENTVFEKNEQLLIKDSLVSYIKELHFLTNIEYKHIKKLTQPKFIKNITPTFEELEFVNNTMIYHFKFSLPFVLENAKQLYIEYNDENDNFNFSIRDITLNNYPNAYSLNKKLIHAKILFDDPSVQSIKTPTIANKNKSSAKLVETNPSIESIKQPSYLELLSQKLNDLKERLKTTLVDIKTTNSFTSFIWLLIFSFVYGVLHAIGPGHGKSLVSSYFINQKKSYLKALSISTMIGVVHTFSAFLLTLFVYFSLGFIFNSALINVEQMATKVSAIIIIAIAVYLLYKKIRKPKQTFSFTNGSKPSSILSPKVTHTQTLSCGCNSCKTTSTDLGVILAAGIVPCPGTVTIFLFTMNLGIYFVGFLSALVMSIGMSLIIFITAIISVKIRKSSSQNTVLLKIFEYLSLVIIFALGLFLLLVS